jgi:hypothetical protein
VHYNLLISEPHISTLLYSIQFYFALSSSLNFLIVCSLHYFNLIFPLLLSSHASLPSSFCHFYSILFFFSSPSYSFLLFYHPISPLLLSLILRLPSHPLLSHPCCPPMSSPPSLFCNPISPLLHPLGSIEVHPSSYRSFDGGGGRRRRR